MNKFQSRNFLRYLWSNFQ